MLENFTSEGYDFDLARYNAFQSCSWDFGLPNLRSDRLYFGIPTNVYAWESDNYTNCGDFLMMYDRVGNMQAYHDNILSFFLDDIKFGATWYKMARFVEKIKQTLKPRAVMLPNYSMWADEPLPEQLYNWYRTLLVGRIWQEMGIDVIPVINWGSRDSYKFAWQGIPKDLPLVWCQCRNIRVGEEMDFIDGLTYISEKINFQSVVTYGWYENKKLMDMIPKNINVIPFMSWNSKKRKIQKNSL